MTGMPDRRTHARRHADRQLTDRQLRSIAVAYLILLVSFALGLWALERRDIGRTDDAAMRTCERVNELRSGLNDNALVLSKATQLTAARERKLARSAANTGERKTHRAAVKTLLELERYYVYRPLTDCRTAVLHPHRFVAPRARPFTPDQLARIHLPAG